MKWDGMRRKENNLHWQNQVQMICIGMHRRETNAIWKCLNINCTVSITICIAGERVECERENTRNHLKEEKTKNLIKFSW